MAVAAAGADGARPFALATPVTALLPVPSPPRSTGVRVVATAGFDASPGCEDVAPSVADGLTMTGCCGRAVATFWRCSGLADHRPMPTPVATSNIAAAAAPSHTLVPNRWRMRYVAPPP